MYEVVAVDSYTHAEINPTEQQIIFHTRKPKNSVRINNNGRETDRRTDRATEISKQTDSVIERERKRECEREGEKNYPRAWKTEGGQLLVKWFCLLLLRSTRARAHRQVT